ncbi:MAG: L,D-transpeptidase family protein [Candidatus Sericytochromatia bacterium]
MDLGIQRFFQQITGGAQTEAVPANGRFQASPELNEIAAGRGQMARGSKGEAVVEVQQVLSDMGFYGGDSIDGAFGRQTQTAVKNFQSSQKLPTTGVVDADTLAALKRVAPEAGKTLWETPTQTLRDQNLIPSNLLKDGQRARAVVDLSEHRLFLFDESGENLKKVYSVATGNPNHPDGKGIKSTPGVKIVNAKNNDPTAIANTLWPETQGKAFGTRLIDLSHQNTVTGKFERSGIELHGTYARNSIGTDASHGCMRMLNEDIEEVFAELKNKDKLIVQE